MRSPCRCSVPAEAAPSSPGRHKKRKRSSVARASSRGQPTCLLASGGTPLRTTLGTGGPSRNISPISLQRSGELSKPKHSSPRSNGAKVVTFSRQRLQFARRRFIVAKGWAAALTRWTDARLINEETAARIRGVRAGTRRVDRAKVADLTPLELEETPKSLARQSRRSGHGRSRPNQPLQPSATLQTEIRRSDHLGAPRLSGGR